MEAPPKVVNLMDALRKSLDTIGAKKKPAAVAPGGRREEAKARVAAFSADASASQGLGAGD